MIKNTTADNQKKYNLYKKMLANLNASINNEFFLQAVFIEYAILEDRCNSIIRVLLGEKPLESKSMQGCGIDKKINKIKNYVHNNTKDAWIKKFLNDDLLDRVLSWKNQRNKMVHSLMVQFDSEDIQTELMELAIAGRNIAKEFKNTAIKIKNHQLKKNKNI